MCLPFKDLEQRRLEKGELHGFEYEIVKNGSGYRCGYIKVLPGHPWFGKGYSCSSDDHYDEDYNVSPNHVCDIFDASVHGGITFADYGKSCPTHGEFDEWWVGFDCAHSGDRPDPSLADDERSRQHMIAENERWANISTPWPETIKDNDYVRSECESLALQAKEAFAHA